MKCRTGSRPHFLADVMLKKAGRWLRILGFDCEFPENEDDDALMVQAANRGLILLTKDEELVARARKGGVSVFHVKKVHNSRQVAEIMNAFKLKMPAKIAPRKCAACNGELGRARKKDVAGKVHKNVLKHYRSFWVCEKCGHVFWKGSHWERIEDEAKNIRKELAKAKKSD